MRRFGLIGYPLGHSFSKAYFSEKFQRENIADCSYENFALESIDKLNELLDAYNDLCGFNVTIPYKSEIIKYLRYVDPDASEIGAVNVVKIKVIRGEKALYGFNSDIKGIYDTLAPFLPLEGDALILGTGGSSKAVTWVLRNAGIKVTAVSRSLRTEEVILYEDITPEIMSETSLIINTTPLGMFPQVDAKPPMRYDLISSRHILFDLVYNPEKTAFLKEGISRGCETVGGLKMLYSQAERAWEIWNDEKF